MRLRNKIFYLHCFLSFFFCIFYDILCESSGLCFWIIICLLLQMLRFKFAVFLDLKFCIWIIVFCGHFMTDYCIRRSSESSCCWINYYLKKLFFLSCFEQPALEQFLICEFLSYVWNCKVFFKASYLPNKVFWAWICVHRQFDQKNDHFIQAVGRGGPDEFNLLWFAKFSFQLNINCHVKNINLHMDGMKYSNLLSRNKVYKSRFNYLYMLC